ncbi:MAG TPA: glycine cleavage system protein H [Terriglobia bacterium]|nr:glycine cleavage system protein H [Terriglobia bacterium]
MVAILIILTIVGFVVADALVQRARGRKVIVRTQAESQPTGRNASRFVFEDLALPQGVFLGAGHTWLSLNPAGEARVGMDDFTQRVMGSINGVELPRIGEQVRRGQKLFAIYQGKRTAEFTAPLDGVIINVNQMLQQNPEPLKSDPFEEGWICSLSPTNLAKDIKQLVVADDAREWLNREIQRFLAFVVARPSEYFALGHVLQDGGEPANGLLEMMDDETWGLFIQKFLKTV